jgi:hypothetical protein
MVTYGNATVSVTNLDAAIGLWSGVLGMTRKGGTAMIGRR